MVTTAPKHPVQTLDTLKADLLERRGRKIPWRAIAADFPGVPPGTLCSISKGREPRSASIRAALGLPVMRLAPLCACGQVHVSKTCPNAPKPPRKPVAPRTDWKRLALAARWALVVLCAREPQQRRDA